MTKCLFPPKLIGHCLLGNSYAKIKNEFYQLTERTHINIIRICAKMISDTLWSFQIRLLIYFSPPH